MSFRTFISIGSNISSRSSTSSSRSSRSSRRSRGGGGSSRSSIVTSTADLTTDILTCDDVFPVILEVSYCTCIKISNIPISNYNDADDVAADDDDDDDDQL